MSLEACAELVAGADPDRHVVTLTAPEDVQRILWPLYAFNVEVTRAPWVTQEVMIAEIRLQWWRDALAEIREGKPVRSHAVTVPLAQVLDAEGAMVLDKLVEARAWDIYADPFPNAESHLAYINATYGNLVWTAARLIAPQGDEGVIRKFAFACGAAALIRATARLKSLGRQPLFDDNTQGLAELARRGLDDLDAVVRQRRSLPASLEPLLMSGWQARPTLNAAIRDPEAVYLDGINESEFARRLRLLKVSYLGWWR